MHIKARSDDPFLRIRFLVPKTGSRRSDGPISRFRFCGENVGRSFAVCSHDTFFRTNKESSIWPQNDHYKFVGAFHLSRRVSDENRACSISIRFFKIRDPFDGRSFLMCSHDPFFGTNKNRILKNGSCERALRRAISHSHMTYAETVPSWFLLSGPSHVKHTIVELAKSVDCDLSCTKLALQKDSVSRKYKSNKEISTILC